MTPLTRALASCALGLGGAAAHAADNGIQITSGCTPATVRPASGLGVMARVARRRKARTTA